MKNRIILFLMLTGIFCSCQSQMKTVKNLSLFDTQLNGDFYKLTKKKIILITEGDSIFEKRYSIKVPSNFISYSSSVSSIPNKTIFKYKNNQRIVIFGNENKVADTFFLALTPDELKEKINEMNLSVNQIENELKHLKGINGLSVKTDHIILYLNIEERNLSQFSESLKSFQYE